MVRLFAAALVVAVVAGAGAGCSRRRGPLAATLLQTQGTVQQRDDEDWRGVVAPFEFVLGDTLRTGPQSSARLRTASGVIRMEENSRLRFSRGAVPTQQDPD